MGIDKRIACKKINFIGIFLHLHLLHETASCSDLSKKASAIQVSSLEILNFEFPLAELYGCASSE